MNYNECEFVHEQVCVGVSVSVSVRVSVCMCVGERMGECVAAFARVSTVNNLLFLLIRSSVGGVRGSHL